MIHRLTLAGLVAAFVLLAGPSAGAADVYFVSDATSGTNIPDVLRGDGHTVTEVTGDYATGNTALSTLSPGDYDCVIWVANGTGPGSAHSDAAVFTALSDYVSSGGRVFVTGYDSIASPADPLLVAFIGGVSASDGASTPGPVISEENSLTIGVVDIQGVTPSGYYSDRDSVDGLLAGTVGVVPSGTDWQWTLRELGAGEVAYVSNGQSSAGGHASWTTTTAGGAGAYNAALRNFVAGAAVGSPRIRWAEDQEFTVPEGSDLLVEVTIEDREGDTYTVGWDLDGDEVYEEETGESVTISAAGMDGPDEIDIDVQACDVHDNCSHRRATIQVTNAPPVLGGDPPDTEILIGEEWTYTPIVTDPGGDEITVTVDNDDLPGSVVLGGGGVRWTPLEEDVGDHALRLEVTDDDDDPEIEGDGDAVLELTITVIENGAPEQPTIVSPDRGVDLAELRPTLVVNNPSDPEGDQLRIFFEVSTTDTFTAPIASEGQALGTDGTTSWTLTEDLDDGVRYHWRAWANDGRNDGPRVSSFFFIDMRSGEDGGPTDGGPDTDGGTEDSGPTGPVAEPGCVCRASGSAAGGSTGLALLLVGLALALAAIRR